MARPHLLALSPEELVELLVAHGVPGTPAEARRVLAHVVSDGQRDLRTMKRPVSRGVRQAVEALTVDERPTVLERARDDADGFEKLLLRAVDGETFEVVRIPLHRRGRFSVCLSSQVGCAMRCAFCATGRLGLQRNLAAHEMVASLLAAREQLGPSERVSGAVFMGQGEPLANYDEVLRTARVLSHPCGGRIDAKNISISTAGLVPQILRYAEEGHRYRLIVSLHSAIADKRRRLLPVTGQWPLEELAAAIRRLHATTRDRVTVAWVVLGGINTGADEVQALQALLGGVPLRINLIDVNPIDHDAGMDSQLGRGANDPTRFTRATPAELARFLDGLQVLGQPIVRRYSGGQHRDAACGMLASRQQAAGSTPLPGPSDAQLP
ncbi:MAG: radical SAM protein [Deltaproteobacteria bacterium]|nr:radical SAM protein [Deltaproteobacteria bacterium]